MAESALAMLGLTRWQIAVGFLGIAGLGWTIHYTRATANAAVAAIELAESTAERQLRAYVGPTRVYFRSFGPGVPASVVVEIKNFGQTPARNYEAALWIEMHPAPLPERPISKKPDFAGRDETLMPDGASVVVCETSAAVPAAIFAAIRTETYALCLVGEITYKDVFGKSRHTEVCKVAIGKRTATDAPFINAVEGNEAT